MSTKIDNYVKDVNYLNFFNTNTLDDLPDIPNDEERRNPSPKRHVTPPSHSGSPSASSKENDDAHFQDADASASESERSAELEENIVNFEGDDLQDHPQKGLIKLMKMNNNWELADLPIGRKAIGYKLVFKSSISLMMRLRGMGIKFEDEIQGLWLLGTLPDTWETFRTSLSDSAPDGGHTMKFCRQLKKENKKKNYNNQKNKHKKDDDGDDNTEVNTTTDEFFVCYDYDMVNLANDDSSWILDSGATCHVATRKDYYSSYTPGDFGVVRMGNTGLSRIAGIGDICLKSFLMRWLRQQFYPERFVESNTRILDCGKRKKGIQVIHDSSEDIQEHCQCSEIQHQKTPPKTPQLNGLAERMNRTLVERVRCLLSHAGLPASFWGEVLNMVVHVINLTLCVPLRFDVPDKNDEEHDKEQGADDVDAQEQPN
ncbi:retrovirus-related pol polyprotein from transposon TNT 1-94 [Tanacetum coccineum]